MYGHAPVAALRSNSLREGCYAECVVCVGGLVRSKSVATPLLRKCCYAERVVEAAVRHLALGSVDEHAIGVHCRSISREGFV